jgi:hypothetical protein
MSRCHEHAFATMSVRTSPVRPARGKGAGSHGLPGQVKEQEQARALRAEGHTLADIAAKLGVAKSSASLWGEGSKGEGEVNFANSDPEMVRFFCAWLRRFFEVDEKRLRVRVYLHLGLDLDAVEQFWSELTQVPRSQFRKPYRAVPDPSIRRNKHEYGCAYVRYTCTKTHRQVMGLVRALLSSSCYSGVAQLAAQFTVNEMVAGSSPAPGAHTPAKPLTIFPIEEKSSRR